MITIQTFRGSRNIGIRIRLPFEFELSIFFSLRKR